MASMKALQNPPVPLTGYGEGAGFGGIQDKADNVYDSTAVSYTHLDVYKRQVIHGIAQKKKIR